MTNLLQTEHITDRDAWNALAAALPAAHVLQSWEWGEFKRATTGWTPERIAFRRAGVIVAAAAIRVRQVAIFRLIYVPKGPLLAYDDAALAAAVLDWLEAYARRRRAVWLKIDPDVVVGTGVPGEDDEAPDAVGLALRAELERRGWRFSADQVQFRNTIQIDLTQSEEALLAVMSQSTRRKVRIAEREGVTVRTGTSADLETLYALYQETGERDHFLVRPGWYYEQAWRAFMDEGLAHALIAEVDGAPVAHVILFRFGRRCWYFYGASSNRERDRMPNYLLQWHAMRWAKAQGCTVYDMWGAPDEFTETDALWGVYNFKRGFRGVVVRHLGAWDFAPLPLFYRLYTEAAPRLLALWRNTFR